MSARAWLLVPTVVLAAAAPAVAQRTGILRTARVAEPANPGLAVSGALQGYRVTSTARVAVPGTWDTRKAPAGSLRFATRQNPSCRYDVTYTVKTVLAPAQDPATYVEGRLPAPGARHVLDSGTRPNRAFRVVRRPGIGGRVRLDALWAGVLTKRPDIAPAGQAAWTEIRVAALSRPGDECHAGTWREALGPSIGDSLAVARTSLRFTKAG